MQIIAILPLLAIFFWLWYAFDGCGRKRESANFSAETKKMMRDYQIQSEAVDSLRKQMFD